MTETGHNASRPLIIVCCHAIYLGKPALSSPVANFQAHHDPHHEENWLLKSFQRSNAGKEGEHLTFIKHIARAVDSAKTFKAKGCEPVICFSGGRTHGVTEVSEAEGYLHVYEAFYAKSARKVLVEDLATDSYQNVLFSILKYNAETGGWPTHITIITHAFKRRRFEDFHLKALKWPVSAATVDGVDPDFTDAERGSIEAAEEVCRQEWQHDLYGCRPPLSRKREERLWREQNLDQYSAMPPNVLRLLRWDGGTDPAAVFPEQLPWETTC